MAEVFWGLLGKIFLPGQKREGGREGSPDKKSLGPWLYDELLKQTWDWFSQDFFGECYTSMV